VPLATQGARLAPPPVPVASSSKASAALPAGLASKAPQKLSTGLV
jgi:hypothetical protein